VFESAGELQVIGESSGEMKAPRSRRRSAPRALGAVGLAVKMAPGRRGASISPTTAGSIRTGTKSQSAMIEAVVSTADSSKLVKNIAKAPASRPSPTSR
jgi:hypothetical protein